MGMMETIVFGVSALILAIFAVALLIGKKPVFSGILGILTLALVGLSAYNWWLALGDSGKNQQWLGFGRYPVAVIILVILAAAGVVCVIDGVGRFAGKNRS